MRTTAALFGIAGVAAVYALTSELRRLDARIPAVAPWLAAAALAVMRWHLHFSRMGIEPILVPLLWAASFWLLLRGWRKGDGLSFLTSGVALAACFYAYQGAWIIPVLALIFVGHWLSATVLVGPCAAGEYSLPPGQPSSWRRPWPGTSPNIRACSSSVRAKSPWSRPQATRPEP